MLLAKQSSDNHTKKMKWPGHVALSGRKKDSYTFSVGKSKGSKSFEKPKNRREF